MQGLQVDEASRCRLMITAALLIYSWSHHFRVDWREAGLYSQSCRRSVCASLTLRRKPGEFFLRLCMTTITPEQTDRTRWLTTWQPLTGTAHTLKVRMRDKGWCLSQHLFEFPDCPFDFYPRALEAAAGCVVTFKALFAATDEVKASTECRSPITFQAIRDDERELIKYSRLIYNPKIQIYLYKL